MELDKLTATQVAVTTPVSKDSIFVSFADGIVPGFAKAYSLAISKKLVGVNNVPNFDTYEIEKYLNFLLLKRVKFVNGSSYPKAIRNLKIPALYALTLAQIGTVYDKQLGITIAPMITDVEEKTISVMTESEAIDFSYDLSILENFNFEMVKGLPFETGGSIDFMYFHVSNDIVLRHDALAHSGIAVLVSFFRQKQLESILTSRVNYGDVSDYDRILTSLIME